MPRASHLFRAFFQAKDFDVNIEEHYAKDLEDAEHYLGEKKRIDDLPSKILKYQIPTLPEQELDNTKQQIESLLLKYNI